MFEEVVPRDVYSASEARVVLDYIMVELTSRLMGGKGTGKGAGKK